jgi:hypothetical protein
LCGWNGRKADSKPASFQTAQELCGTPWNGFLFLLWQNHGGGSALPLHAPTHQFCAVPARPLFVHKYFQKYSKKLFILGKKCGKVKTCQMWSIPHHNKYICRVGRAYPGAKRGL